MGQVKMAKEWEELSPQEKREERFQRWLSPDIKFASAVAEKLYKERVTKFIKAIKLKEPDRVPCILSAGYLPASYAGYSLKEVMYDYKKLADAWMKFNRDFQPDSFLGPGLVSPVRVLEIIGHKLHKWPGHGLTDDAKEYGVYK